MAANEVKGILKELSALSSSEVNEAVSVAKFLPQPLLFIGIGCGGEPGIPNSFHLIPTIDPIHFREVWYIVLFFDRDGKLFRVQLEILIARTVTRFQLLDSFI